jgi:hypothetical protein
MKNGIWVVAGLLAMGAGAACDDGLGPNDGMDVETAADIALETDAMAGEIVFGQLLFVGFGADPGLSANGEEPRSFSRSRPCPAGGNIELNGTIERTAHGDGVVEFEAAANGKWNACARTRREITRTINGEFSLESHRRIVNGQAAGPQTSTKQGHFTWTSSNGKSGECEFNVTSTRFPEEGKRTVQGTVCGREIDRTVSWRRNDG